MDMMDQNASQFILSILSVRSEDDFDRIHRMYRIDRTGADPIILSILFILSIRSWPVRSWQRVAKQRLALGAGQDDLERAGAGGDLLVQRPVRGDVQRADDRG